MQVVITSRMSTEELEQLRQELEARLRRILEANPNCHWLKKTLQVDDPDAEAAEPEADDIDEFLSDLNLPL